MINVLVFFSQILEIDIVECTSEIEKWIIFSIEDLIVTI